MASPLYIIYQDNNGIEHSVYFDIVTNINHIGESQASEFPLEDGAPMTDHVINLPSNLTFTVGVTNSPFPSNPGASLIGFSDGALPYPNINPQFVPFGPLQYPESNLSLAGVASQLNLNGAINAISSAVGLGPDTKPQPVQRLSGRLSPPIGPQPNTSNNFITTEQRCQNMFNELNLIRTSNYLCTIVTAEKTYPNMVLLTINSPVTVDSGNSIEFSITSRQIRIVSLTQADVPVPSELIAAVKRKSGSKNGTVNTGEVAQQAQSAKATGYESPIAQQEAMLGENLRGLGL